ncbi:FAD-dependent monooxygenase [Streptomyces europaeiscabiei]|uniref:FAD-dependent monooxygenase n=1 Tax=Streptomyces europaeiscabiei TaxID=146819 RepID=UPI0038F7F767
MFRAMEQDSEGVLAVVRDRASGATETLAWTYLVACDGGRSGIRRALDIPFEGMFAQVHNFAVHFRAPQLLDLMRERLGGPAVQIHTLSSARRAVHHGRQRRGRMAALGLPRRGALPR